MTTTSQQTNTPSPAVQNAGETAFGFASSLAGRPFAAPLAGTAGFTPQQAQSFAQIGALASAPHADNPFFDTAANDYAAYGAAALPRIAPQSALGGGVGPSATTLQSYIDPSLQMELAPTLQAIGQQAQIAMNGPGGVGSQATAAGAFGDARQGVQNAMTDYQAMLAAGQATGQAYRHAFDTALAARQGDVANAMSAQSANEQIAQQQLANLVGSGNALTNLAQYTTGTGLNLAQALGQAGTQQQQVAQQQLGALYNQQLQDALGPYQVQLPALTSALAALTPTQPSTSTVQQPNNAGWNILGSILGSGFQGLGQGFGQAQGLKTLFS